MRFINWILKKLIAKERKRQIALGYTRRHDIEHIRRDPNYFGDMAQEHYLRGPWVYVEVLAILEAEKEAFATINLLNQITGVYPTTRLSEYK